MNMLPFSLWHYCLIDITHMRLPCALSHTLDLFHNLFVYISILQLVPFKFVGFFFLYIAKKNNMCASYFILNCTDET